MLDFHGKKISGQRLIYTAIVGKPMKETYYHAEYLISHHANKIGLQLPIKRLYAIGVCSSFRSLTSRSTFPLQDNPDTDIYGANVYNRYLQNRTLSQSMTSDRNLCDVAKAVELLVDDAERYYSAESLQSILVCTGVYNRETYDETSDRNHAPRDVIVDPELKLPKHTCEHVLDAVKLIFQIEQFQ